jgi:hypothetical protein
MSDTTAPPVSLVEFLRARLDEQEAWNKSGDFTSIDNCQECAFGEQPESPYSTALLLADIAAKRAIIRNAKVQLAWADQRPDDDPNVERIDGAATVNESVLEYLALPHADHPDYREEWKP